MKARGTLTAHEIVMELLEGACIVLGDVRPRHLPPDTKVIQIWDRQWGQDELDQLTKVMDDADWLEQFMTGKLERRKGRHERRD